MTCCWAGCTELAIFEAEGREGSEHFTLELCERHWKALGEQVGPWHLTKAP